MKLRGRFTLWFGLAALVPITAAALVTRSIVSGALRDDAERGRAVSTKEMQRVLSVLEDDVKSRVAGLATSEGGYAGGTLLELQTHEGVLPSESRKRLSDSGGPLMRQLSLDLLYLLDHNDRVLDAPHYVPALGEKAEDLGTAARENDGKPYYAMETLLEPDGIKSVLVLEAARTLQQKGYAVSVVGARRIEAELFTSVRKLEGVRLRVVGPRGNEIIAPEGAWSEKSERFSFPLLGRDGKEIARVEMSIVNEALPAVLEKVTLYSAALALAALLLTLLLGFLVAKRITRDLDFLVDGAHAVARGELDHQVQTRSDDEVGEVAEALNTMMVELADSKERLMMAERVAAWQEIARRLAHEIKNPLTPIQMSMETLRKTYQKKHPSFDEIFEESTATVLEEAGRLKRIVAEFSEFARMPKPNKVSLDVGALITAQLSLYAGSARIEKHLADTLPQIQGDKDTLSQLILNLIENARDATRDVPEGAVGVTTEVSREGRAVAIHVDDNGPGVSGEARDKLFTPYYTTKHAHGGTGLGLAIAHRIVSDHHGKISVGQSPMGGARFSVELPIVGEDSVPAGMSASMKRFR